MGAGFERTFAVVAAVVLVASVVAVVAAPAAGRTGNGLAVETSVPAEYAFDAPTAAGRAVVDGRRYASLQAAVDAAVPGDVIVLRGRFDERVTVRTPGVTLASAPGRHALIDGGGADDVLTIDAPNVTVRRVWVRNSGLRASENDAGIWVNGSDVRIVDARVTDVTFGVWIDGVDRVTVRNTTIVGREAVRPLSYRGNGIQIWKSVGSRIVDNRITDVRDGIYYSWASDVLASGNTMWDLRFGVHYMYSDDCVLRDNLAFGNDVGYALMVSKRLVIEDNVAVDNRGGSGHGILVKSIDETEIRGNALVGNRKGLYVFNSLDNEIADNLVLENDVGVHLAAGSVREHVTGNSFINNDRPVLAVVASAVTWNGTDRGNYWSGAPPIDRDRDGVGDVRYRPAGVVEHLIATHPQAAVFVHSPAFDAMRLAEGAFPVVEAPGVVDHHPLAAPPHEDWRRYYAT